MRILLIMIFMFAACFISLTPAYAAKGPKLELIYGEDLMKVPQIIKVKYLNDTGKAWEDVTLEERSEFLATWQQKRLEDQEVDKKQAKEITDIKKNAAAKDRARMLKKIADQRAQLEKDKAKQEEEKAKEDKKRMLVKKREDALRSLRKTQTERNQKLNQP